MNETQLVLPLKLQDSFLVRTRTYVCVSQYNPYTFLISKIVDVAIHLSDQVSRGTSHRFRIMRIVCKRFIYFFYFQRTEYLSRFLVMSR